ncbi:MAG: hypothetical protein JXK16_08240 [Thiotrichales bacterium]|nr:hypothetical protein [Thiotrichales bacterium]
MSNSALNELGFAEFVAKLISDTFSAILSSQVEQKDKLAELDRLMTLSNTDFLAVCLEDGQMMVQVEDQLRQLFPSEKEPGHGIVVGAAYQPETNSKPESPAIYQAIGLQLSKETPDFKGGKLTQLGVDKIYQALVEPLAEQQRNALASILNDGIPKLMVDSGKINAKLTFQTSISEDEEEPASGATTSTVADSPSTVTAAHSINTVNNRLATLSMVSNSRFIGAIDTKKLLHTRLSVVPASNKAPQDAQTTANIYSEIEIHFKTIL